VAELNSNLNLKDWPSQGPLDSQPWWVNVYANEGAIKQGSLKNLP